MLILFIYIRKRANRGCGDGYEGNEGRGWHSTTCGSFHYLGKWYSRAQLLKYVARKPGHPPGRNNRITWRNPAEGIFGSLRLDMVLVDSIVANLGAKFLNIYPPLLSFSPRYASVKDFCAFKAPLLGTRRYSAGAINWPRALHTVALSST